MEASQVVIEEVMRAAVDAARKAATSAAAGDRHAAGQVFAYHNILDVLKEQATLLGVVFADIELQGFNPDELLTSAMPRKAA
jgi:hypothetical protein